MHCSLSADSFCDGFILSFREREVGFYFRRLETFSPKHENMSCLSVLTKNGLQVELNLFFAHEHLVRAYLSRNRSSLFCTGFKPLGKSINPAAFSDQMPRDILHGSVQM